MARSVRNRRSLVSTVPHASGAQRPAFSGVAFNGLRWTLTLFAMAAAPVVAAAQTPRELAWAGDSEGGAPYVEADPSHPDRVIGFEVEIADLLARGLGRTPRFINITFATPRPVDRQRQILASTASKTGPPTA